jgi:methyl-accepting chemotaxis protein/methyl-accepting chemotaxis protein-1 (serine sensor receptor)
MEFSEMSSFTIGKKLFLGAGVLVVFAFALGITALIGMSSVGDRVHTIVDVSLRKQILASQMDVDGSELISWTRGIVLRGFMKDPPTIEQYNQQFLATAEDLQTTMNTLQPMLFKPEARQALQETQEAIATIREVNQTIYKAAMAGDMPTAVSAFTDKLMPARKRQEAASLLMLKVQEETFATDAQGTEESIASNRWITSLLLALTCCVGIAVIFVVRQINAVLRRSVVELSESVVQIASAAGQVASSSQSLAQGASEQTATIEETSSASTEINSMARRTTENSHKSAEMVTRSQEDFEKTNQSLAEMVSAMDGINGSSQKISKIIKVIDEIAFQTNILALNAAVEAARAGEAGMGFAVVADEVRNLAQRCAQAAKDTADLIEESIQRSDGGRVKVDQVAVAIRAITAESAKIKVLVDEINLGSVEQSNGIDQISRAITQMEQVTQSNAASAEESAAAAEELNAQAEHMKDVVSSLRAMVDGANTGGTDARSASSRHAWLHSISPA